MLLEPLLYFGHTFQCHHGCQLVHSLTLSEYLCCSQEHYAFALRVLMLQLGYWAVLWQLAHYVYVCEQVVQLVILTGIPYGFIPLFKDNLSLQIPCI